MSHTIINAARLAVVSVEGDMATIHTLLQTKLQTLSNGDHIISIDLVRNRTSNLVMAYITYEY